MNDWQNAGFGIYVHWPFCLHKCPYCDFNSHVSREIDQDRWRRALVQDLTTQAHETSGRTVDTIFFGGGTPSLMPPETVAAVIETIGKVWTLAPSAEITLEANPTSVEAARFAAYADAGVNRISMGIQSLNDDHLKALGRMHTVAEARAAFDIARDQFDRVSFDLIYARQRQTLADWRAELTEALDMAVDHLSLYQLTIEDGTRFGDMYTAGKLRDLPADDLAADMYFATQEICDHKGLPAYEISNHARPGAESQHNLIYWRYGDYIGVGPGAHGRITKQNQRFATEAYRSPNRWLDTVEAQGDGLSETTPLTAEDQTTEYLLMSLRLTEGTEMDRFTALGGQLDTARITPLIDDGYLEMTNRHLKATTKGRPVLNALLRELL